jgi:AcrR family transcriptional regulator
MRAISEKTGIAVTTIYERFDDRGGLMHALAVHVAEQEAKRLTSRDTVRSIEEIFDYYLQFAKASPHRYKLLADTFVERMDSGETAPAFDLTKKLLAKRLGGTPEQHEERALGVFQLLAGAVTATLSAGDRREYRDKARKASKTALRLLLADCPRNS